MRGKMNFLLLLAFISSVTSTDWTVIEGMINGENLSTDSTIPSDPLQSSRPDTMTSFGIPYEMWKCGSGEYITKQVILGINRTCPAAAADFNHCCAVHDDCYGNKRGRDNCDQKFCECLQYYAENTEGGAPCVDLTKYACTMVRQFGAPAYTNHADADPSSVEPYLSKQLPRIEKDYENVYEKCTTQYVTLASCALNFDICHNDPIAPKTSCVLNLLRCVDDTRNDRHPNKECDVAVEELLLKLVIVEDQKPESATSGVVEGSGDSGDVNVLMLQGIMKNQTFVRKIYLQIVKTTSSLSWIVYLCFFLCIFLCCIVCIIGLTRYPEADRGRRHQEEVINVRVTSTPSETGSRRKGLKTCSESEATSPSSKSSVKK